MIEKIVRLGKETAVYGLSTIAGRLLNFLIVPFYANVLLPAENGVVSNVYAYIAFAFVVFCYGMEPAYMRYVASLEIGDRRQNFSVPFFSLVSSSLLLAVGLHGTAPALAELIGIGRSHADLVRYSGWILCFDALSVVPFASLRMDHRASAFAGIKLLNIFTNLTLNVVLIVGLHMRMQGVFLANLLASVVTFLALVPVVRRNITFALPKDLYRHILKFGIPYIPAGLAGMANQVIDRPIVKALTNDATLGIYQLNYRLGIFMMLIVGMFDYAWRPFFLTHAKDPDAKELFARVFTYFVLMMMTIFLGVSLFIEDAVRMTVFGRQFFPPAYWDGTAIVPVVLLAYVFTGIYVVFVVGVYLEKKTQYLPLITGAGAAVNVGANLFLIPRMGIMGAAIATLLSYMVMAVGMYGSSQRFYPVRYEWGKVTRTMAFALGLFAILQWINPPPLASSGLALKLALFLAFPLLLWFTRVIDAAEIAATRKMILGWFSRPPASPPDPPAAS